ARLAHDPVALLIAPLPASVVDRQSIRKAQRDLAIEEIQKLRLAHPEAVADLAPEQQLGHLLRLQRRAAGNGLRRSADDKQWQDHDGRKQMAYLTWHEAFPLLQVPFTQAVRPRGSGDPAWIPACAGMNGVFGSS